MSRARFAVAAFAAIALIAAGCGDDDDDGGDTAAETTSSATEVPGAEEAAALQEEIADLGDEEQVARVGEEWAALYGSVDETMCGYLHPDLGGPSSCAEYVDGALTGSSDLQRTYADATVEDVSLTGSGAVATFSNGEEVTFTQADGAWRVSGVPRVN